MNVSAKADVITASIAFDPSNQASFPDTTDYEGNFFDGTQAPYDITIGTFNFTIPTSETVIGATISGTFGDVNVPVTALTDLYVDGGTIDVANCDDPTALCATGTAPSSWSHTFTSADLANLATDLSAGSIDFTAVQNSFGVVVVGDPTLTIEAVTPEPGSIFTLAGGLLVIAAYRRRK